MASGYPGRDLRTSFAFGNGSAVQIPFQSRSEAGGGGFLKRSLTEMERQHQQQMQHQQALFLRSVKQKTHLASPISPLSPFDLPSLSPSPPSSCFSADFGGISSSSCSSMAFTGSPASSGFGFGRRQPSPCPGQAEFSFSAAATAGAGGGGGSDPAMRNRLQELERRLLDDDDEGEGEGSAVTNTEWSEAMQQLISPAPPAATTQSPLSPSPTTSSSSSSSSSASCSPSTSTPSSRQMLLDTAAAIADGNPETAAANLAILKRAANPRGDPEQRLTAMMVTALMARLNAPPQGTRHHLDELCSLEHVAATQMLHELSPCFKLALYAANVAILDATRDCLKIHIVDFDAGGGQYVALIHALAERRRGGHPPSVRITAVAEPPYPFNGASAAAGGNLRVVGDRLLKLAERAGVLFQFKVLSRRAAEVDREALKCEPGEALAVNLAFVASRIADESVTPANPRDELLRRVKSLQPAVVTLVEQEMNGNTAPFATRFTAACAHYGAVVESLEAAAGRESGGRERVEAGLTLRAANSVAREGADRLERPEVFGKWRARMGMAGFRPVPLGPAAADVVRARAGTVRGGQGVTVKEEAGGLGLGWFGRVVNVASAWR